MNIDKFIKRPVLSAVISILICLVGVLALTSLPTERYPDIAPPTIQVSTMYPGASAETIRKSVVLPLEDAINGVEDMIYISSQASNAGVVDISVVFKQGADADKACVNVQNRVAKAMSLLPAEVSQMGVSVEKSQNSMLQVFSIYSPDDTYDEEFLGNYASINIKPVLMRISGLGKFQMLGSEYSLRIWLDPSAMASHNLTPNDVSMALAEQNIEAPTGTLGANSSESYQYTMKYTGRLKTIEEFEDIVVRAEGNHILRLGDVAKIELGVEDYSFVGETDGHPGIMCICYQAAGSNATQVNNDIDEALKKIKDEAPSGIEFGQIMSANHFLDAAMGEVANTLRDAIILVILIVLIFLKDFRSTVIPFISIMVSLIGTFAFMLIAGFSINLLTLFALVLVIGTVVDDAIVVVEAVHAQFEAGITSPFKATVAASKEVAMPVITSSLVFMAVFIPVSFMPGTSGIFYKQFGLTMAVAVAISALNALTLVPALSAKMLKPAKEIVAGEKPSLKQRYSQWFDNLFDKLGTRYKNSLTRTIHRKWLVWVLVIISFGGLVFLLNTMPSGLVPMEDQGLFVVEVGLPAGSSLSSTTTLTHDLSEDMRQIDGVEMVSSTSGYGFLAGQSASAGCVMIKLKHWDERKGDNESMLAIYSRLLEVADRYPNANVTIFTLPMIPGYGTNGGIDLYVQDKNDGDIHDLFDVTQDFVKELGNRGVEGYVAFDLNFPQWEVNVDVAKCKRMGVSPQEVLGTMSSYMGGSYISSINLYSKVYKVMMQGSPETHRDERSLDETYVRTGTGNMTPLSTFVTLKRVYGPEVIRSFNKLTSINVSASSSKSTGEAIAIIQQTAKETLPDGYTIDFAGMSREQANQGSLGLILILCSFIIYLILAALYESWIIPFSVLLVVPVGLACSFGISSLVGLDNNIYVQTGVIMLIGLLAKTGILITEVAVNRHKEGMPIEEAAVTAGMVRLRPIIMTVLCMVIGLLPLVLSVGGVGGMGNFSLGLGTIVGLSIGAIALVYIVPTLYTTFQKLQDKTNKGSVDYEE